MAETKEEVLHEVTADNIDVLLAGATDADKLSEVVQDHADKLRSLRTNLADGEEGVLLTSRHSIEWLTHDYQAGVWVWVDGTRVVVCGAAAPVDLFVASLKGLEVRNRQSTPHTHGISLSNLQRPPSVTHCLPSAVAAYATHRRFYRVYRTGRYDAVSDPPVPSPHHITLTLLFVPGGDSHVGLARGCTPRDDHARTSSRGGQWRRFQGRKDGRGRSRRRFLGHEKVPGRRSRTRFLPDPCFSPQAFDT